MLEWRRDLAPATALAARSDPAVRIRRMLPGPVFTFELLTTARRARYYVVRLVYGLILLWFICQNNRWFAHRQMTIQEMSALGMALSSTYMITQAVAVLLLTPALVAGVIADEKQRKTLHYLLGSPLTSGEIVLGKLLARCLHLAVLMAVGLPIISLLSLFGGVDPTLILLGFAATSSMAYFVAAMSILVSTVSKRPREAISVAYILVLAWLFGPPLVTLIMPLGGPTSLRIYEWIRPVNVWISSTSPFDALFRLNMLGRAGPGAIFEFYAWMIGLQLAYGTALIALAVLLLRPSFRRADSSPRWLARLAAMRRGRRLLPRPECGDDAMLWKERHVSRTGVFAKAVAALIVLAVGALIVYGTFEMARDAFAEVASYGYGSGPEGDRNEFNGVLRLVCTLGYCILYIGVASAAAAGVTREREEDTWTSLTATPLEGREILLAKMIGAVWGMRWLAGVLLAFWLIGLAAGSIHPLAFAAVAIETAVFVWFATALGTYVSLRARSSGRAMTATIGLLIVLNGAYLMCCIPFEFRNTALPLAGVTPLIEAGSLATYGDVRWTFSRALRGDGDAIPTGIVGVLGYAFAALLLTISALGRFDVEAGRPSRTTIDPTYGYRGKDPLTKYLEDDEEAG
jgi:ABC-type transport system involved in multi-copper enzyme maturation permease subunit